MAAQRLWVSKNSLQLVDPRTNTKFRVAFPYADEPGFYSPDELEELVGYAVEKFEAHCADKPTHLPADKAFQNGLGRTLQDIRKSSDNRKELGGPKYHLIRKV